MGLRRQFDMSPRPRRSIMDKSQVHLRPVLLACLPQQAALHRLEARNPPVRLRPVPEPCSGAPRPGETCLPARPMATGQAARRGQSAAAALSEPAVLRIVARWVNLVRGVVLSMDPIANKLVLPLVAASDAFMQSARLTLSGTCLKFS